MFERAITVGELQDELNHYPREARVYFTPRSPCCGGFPEWVNAHVKMEMAWHPDENDQPTGRIEIALDGEQQDE